MTTETTTAKLRGTVKTIKDKEGYAFITDAATGEDYFMHRSSVEMTSPVGWEDLAEDMVVLFTPISGPKGLRAIEVRVLTETEQRETAAREQEVREQARAHEVQERQRAMMGKPAARRR